jgi:hypothetical protein
MPGNLLQDGRVDNQRETQGDVRMEEAPRFRQSDGQGAQPEEDGGEEKAHAERTEVKRYDTAFLQDRTRMVNVRVTACACMLMYVGAHGCMRVFCAIHRF